MSTAKSTKYLDKILNEEKADICFLPGDDQSAKLSGIVRGYGQYLSPTADGTILLYNSSKVQMKKPDVNFSVFGHLPGIDFDQMVCPQVEITTHYPERRVVKEFNLISWKYTLYSEPKTDISVLTESILLFSQRLALQTGKGVLIGGEMTIDYSLLQQIVKKVSTDQDELFMANMQPEMSQLGYLPSMTKGSFREHRHLYKMDLYRCSGPSMNDTGSGVVKTWKQADCFIASKTLELTEAKLVNVEQVLGREISVKCPLKEHAPTKTEMVIPPRPPRHHGG